MPATQQQPTFTTEEAERFAALVAGIDLGSPNDAEAAGKFRALRQMLAGKNIRLVDALELPEIRKAIDDQMHPERKEGPALQEAMEQAAALREELTARTRDVRTLAELVTLRDQTIESLRDELAAVDGAANQGQARKRTPRRAAAPSSSAAPCVSGGAAPVMAFWVVVVAVLIWGISSCVGCFQHSQSEQAQNNQNETLQRPSVQPEADDLGHRNDGLVAVVPASPESPPRKPPTGKPVPVTSF